MNLEGTRIVTDNHTYELGRELGRGGQGAVFSIKGSKRAVKVLFNRSSTRRDLLRQQLRHVHQMSSDLRELAIARPLEMLQPPHLGYVMELVTGMVPLSKLIDIPRNVNSRAEWYLNGGGLRRRLLLLARCAEVLSQLHGKGLVYSDPSPNNIFVSTDIDAYEIRLIDADNLHFENAPSTKSFHTPGYGAPELVLGRSGVNTLTDAHAFAVIAFQTLCLIHPLMGDLVTDGEPELEQQALEGSLPWIDHPEDRRNATDHGLPRDFVLSPKLKKLCQRCFGEGLRESIKRPGISQWTEDLYSAADFIIECPDCQSTYYANQKACPWCDYPRPTFVQLVIKCWEPLPELQERQKFLLGQRGLATLAMAEHQPLTLTNRIISGRTGIDSHTPAIELQLENDDIKIRSLNGQCFWLTPEGEQQMTVEVREAWKRFPANPGRSGTWLLHFAPLERSHRLATFKLIPGGR
ncbi:serine/threonine-protein kinase [Nostoc sp.]|uniref:serine/threonine-protein kinase n=1 Tax=Nostoc sp. TaxID=1180 RepID=UPI002FFA22DF